MENEGGGKGDSKNDAAAAASGNDCSRMKIALGLYTLAGPARWLVGLIS